MYRQTFYFVYRREERRSRKGWGSLRRRRWHRWRSFSHLELMNPTIWPICSQAVLRRRWLCTVNADGPDTYWGVFSCPNVCFWTFYFNQVWVNDIRQPEIIRLYKSNVGSWNNNNGLNTNTGQNTRFGFSKKFHLKNKIHINMQHSTK